MRRKYGAKSPSCLFAQLSLDPARVALAPALDDGRDVAAKDLLRPEEGAPGKVVHDGPQFVEVW